MVEGRPIPNEAPEAWRPRGRVPPHSLAAEASLLGAMLLKASAIEVATEHLAGPEDFYVPAHAELYEAVLALHDRQEPVDLTTVMGELARRSKSTSLSRQDLAALQDDCPATSNAAAYATTVALASRARRGIAQTDEAREALYELDLEGAQKALGEMELATAPRALCFEDVGAVLRGEVAPFEPVFLRRSDGAALMYPGQLHWLMGPTGKGKSWVALLVAQQCVKSGTHVVYLDWEGNRRQVGERLAALGCSDAEVDEFFHYRRPGIADDTAAMVAFCIAHDVGVVVCDGVARSMAARGLDEDRAPDVMVWLTRIAFPLTEAGAAVLCLDHVTKDVESRGLYARGSGAKIDQVSGAAWMLKTHGGFSRTKAGRIDLIQAKDREGFVGTDGGVVAVIQLEPRAGMLEVRVDPPAQVELTPLGTPRRTWYMARVSDALAGSRVAVTGRWVERNVEGKAAWVREALRALVEEGHVELDPASRYELVKPFRELSEEDGDDTL